MALSDELISQFVRVTNDSPTKSAESTHYGTVVRDEEDNKIWLQLDGSDEYTPITTTTDYIVGERVIVRIKDHTATIIGNLSSPAARTEDVKEAGNKITVVQNLVADKVSSEELSVERARIDDLVTETATIRGLLTADNAEIGELVSDNVEIKQQLTANKASIDNLSTNKLDATVAAATYATIEKLEATDAKVYSLESTYADFETLTTEKLDAVDAELDNLDTKYAKVSELDVERGRINDLEANMITADHVVIKDLEADVAHIDTVMFGTASGDVIQTSFANMVISQLGDAQIKSAMIESVSADKIVAGDIITNNVRVKSEDGNLLISDETMQISDSNRVRVQIGKDSSGDYSINIWDQNGKLMFSKGGITDDAIKEAIIRNDMVSDTANIAAHKLDIDSLFEEINGSVNIIKSSKIYFDDEKQTLDVAFKSLGTEVTRLGTTTSSQGTQISVIQGQIASKVWQQDIDTATNTMSTQYSELDQKIDGVSATVASHTTEIENKADASTVTTVSNRVNELESNLSGFKSTVSTTYATKTEVNDISIGGRNLLRDSKRILLISNNSAIYPVTCVKMDENGAEFNRVQRTGYPDYPELALSLFSGIPTTQFNYHEMTGKQVTLSFKARTSHNITGRFMANTYGGPESIYFDMPAALFTTEWTVYHVVIDDFPDMSERTGIRLNPYLFQLTEDNIEEFYLDVRDYKFELGNKPTDWTPAPEDVQSSIDQAQSAANAAQEAANQNAAEMAAIVTNFNAEVAGLQTQIDGSITTWFYEYEPTNSNKPAVDWTTVDQKNVHLGDLCYDTITGYCYRWQVQNNSYSWQRLTDTDVTKALADAQTAKDVADQKRRVFYAQPTPPYDEGDLWVQGSDGDILRCQTAKTSDQNYATSDWVVASKYTDDTLANTANTNALAAQSTATQAKNDIDGLTIGGRNLVLKSAQELTNNAYCTSTHNVSSPLVPGITYTISVNTTPAENVTCLRLFVCGGWTMVCQLDVTDTGRQTLVKTFVMPQYYEGRTPEDNASYGDVQLYRYPNDDTVISDSTIHWVKIEQGNRSTDWTPAPEDAETKISTLNEQYSTLDQTVKSISATVVSNSTAITKKADQSTVTEVSNKLTQVEADLDGYKTTVSDTYISKTDAGVVNLVNEQFYTAAITGTWEPVGDGWLRYRHDNTNGSNVVYGIYRFTLSDYVAHLPANTPMTVMIEMRDLGSTDGVYAYSHPENTDGVNLIQVYGTTYVYAVNARNDITSSRLTTAYVMPESVNGKAKTSLGGWLVAVPAGATADVLLRQGIYEGIYLGNYVPPVGDMRSLINRVGSAETSITQNSESITSLADRTQVVENKFGNYSTTAQMNSVIEQTASNITSSVSATYSTKTETANAVNGIQVGSRNLLLDSGTERTVERNYCHVVAPIDLHSGDIYSYSVWLKASENTTARAYLNDDSGQNRVSVVFANSISLTTEYQRFAFEGQTPAADSDFLVDQKIYMRVYAPEGIILTGKLAKLEIGNKVTDWTPAPEDLATSDDAQLAYNTATAAQETASNAETLIQQLTDSISTLVTDGNGTSLMTQTEEGWTFSTADIQTSINETAEGLDTLTNDLGSAQGKVGVLEQTVKDLEEIAERVKIGTWTDPDTGDVNPSIELSEGDSDFKQVITNKNARIMEGETVVTEMNTEGIETENLTARGEIRQGSWVWVTHGKGNLGLMWKEVSS